MYNMMHCIFTYLCQSWYWWRDVWGAQIALRIFGLPRQWNNAAILVFPDCRDGIPTLIPFLVLALRQIPQIWNILLEVYVRIITRKYFYSEWYDALRCVIRKLAPNHVSVIFGSEGCQRRVSQGHKMSKNALDAVQGFLRRVSEGAMAFLWWVSVAPNLNSADCQGASYD